MRVGKVQMRSADRFDFGGCAENTDGDDDSEPDGDLLRHVLYVHAWGIRVVGSGALMQE